MRAARLSMLAGLVLAFGCGGESIITVAAAPTPTPTVAPCPFPEPFCGGDFPLNTIQTTQYGPAWADVVLGPSDLVPCFGPYALCFYSDCTVSPDGTVSDCPCFDWFGTSFVVISDILNLDLYQSTKAQCDADPDSCKIPNGAPVCGAINNGTFLNGATRISTFSFYRAKQEPIGQTDCTGEPGLYAGCMTGPCFGEITPNEGERTATIQCDCPNYEGPFQIGKDGLMCSIDPDAWSASYNPNPPQDPCDLVDGCVPDAPVDACGCPLYGAGTMLPPDSGVDCETVCQEYTTCTGTTANVQLGYTCDATLCTSNSHDLVFEACSGLQNCELGEIFKAEKAAGCSCCASQLCNCDDPNAETNAVIAGLNEAQRVQGDTPQCDTNGTLCGAVP